MKTKPISYSLSSEPYSYQAHAARCAEAARSREVLVQHVLARRGPIVYCAVIKELWVTPDGKDCWTLETLWPEKARLTIPVRNVIQCGGEFCSCKAAAGACAGPAQAASEAPPRAGLEQADPDPGFSQAGVVAPPDSLIFEKPHATQRPALPAGF
ncbi:hypothetical protein [Polaromonas sp.]|uniref:hypothetical protein n=1 Tax=Polaromonas sp. TaxID=1869339 RepID=UPI0032645036